MATTLCLKWPTSFRAIAASLVNGLDESPLLIASCKVCPNQPMSSQPVSSSVSEFRMYNYPASIVLPPIVVFG